LTQVADQVILELDGTSFDVKKLRILCKYVFTAISIFDKELNLCFFMDNSINLESALLFLQDELQNDPETVYMYEKINEIEMIIGKYDESEDVNDYSECI